MYGFETNSKSETVESPSVLSDNWLFITQQTKVHMCIQRKTYGTNYNMSKIFPSDKNYFTFVCFVLFCFLF